MSELRMGAAATALTLADLPTFILATHTLHPSTDHLSSAGLLLLLLALSDPCWCQMSCTATRPP